MPVTVDILEGPSVEPVTLEMVKAHCRLYGDLTDDDELLGVYLAGAREYLEGITARAIVNQTVKETREVPQDGVMRLYRAPVREILSVVVDGVTLSEDSYSLRPNRIVLKSPSAGSQAVVTYTAGYGDSADDVPAYVKHAILLMVGQAYERREPILAGTIVAALPFSLQALIARMSWGGEIPTP